AGLHEERGRGQRLFPVVDPGRRLVGVATRNDLARLLAEGGGLHPIGERLRTDPVVAYPDEPLRTVVYRMADTGLTRFPVVERGEARRLIGMVALSDLLQARVRSLEAERRRERVLPLRLLLPRGLRPRRRAAQT